jgi:phenylacetate-CoA ligase
LSEKLEAHSTSPGWHRKLQFLFLGPRDVLLYIVCRTYRTFVLSFRILSPRYLAWTSKIRGLRAFYRSARDIPAYSGLVEQSNLERNGIPETDKASYIDAFSIDSRCVHGKIPHNNVMIDESSGSTGTPYNWVRNIKERHQAHLFVSYFTRYCFGEGPFVFINAFSMGAWATGQNMGIALQKNGIVKNTGPDIPKILSTLVFFGPKRSYLILGYPPFLKQLIDVAKAENFVLSDYQLYALVGGEGMSEGLRDYLLKQFRKVFSGYGATDLEIGIAGETPVSVQIRRLARVDKKVRNLLFGPDSRLPMVFQYNPLMHFIETNKDREVVITITRSTLLSPRIRYNIHDEGGVARYDQIHESLESLGIDVGKLLPSGSEPIIRLPFLWIYGRRDFTISVMGANIYPEDLEQALYANHELAKITRSFCLSKKEYPNGDTRPAFYFEIDTTPNEELKRAFAESILEHLLKINADFKEAWKECRETLVPEIYLFEVGQGPFSRNHGQIKQVRRIDN